MVRALRIGVPAGIIGGAVMAAWSMIAMWLTGSGFWTPLNLIGHFFYKSAPLNATFSVPAAVVGLAVHMTVASIFGTAIALLAQRMPGRRSAVIAAGIVFIAVVWPLMQWEVWYRLDEDAAEGFTGWIFAVAHLCFGLTAAGFAAIGIDNDDSAKRGRHAKSRTLPQPALPSGSLFQPGRRNLPGASLFRALRHHAGWRAGWLAGSWPDAARALTGMLAPGATGWHGGPKHGTATRPG